jgi:hypothetical protein
MLRSRPLLLRLAGFAVVLLTALAGCSSGQREVASAEWGAEAVVYFDRLADAYKSNDVYGILDFYTPVANIEKWRGDNRGGWPIPDLVKWNSGDLGVDVVSVHLGDAAALTLVRWPSSSDLGAVVSEIDGGRIDREVHFDLGSSLEQSLRALPATIGTYEDLYAAYAVAWTADDQASIAGLYEPGAHVQDVVGVGAPVPFEEVVDDTTGLRWDPIQASDVFGDTVAMDGPAVFLGPIEYGSDPQRAVGIYLVTDADECEYQVAVRWNLEDGHIVDEQRFHETESYRACADADPTDGWWSGLALPAAVDQIATGSVATNDGGMIEVRNGTPTLVGLFEWGLGRFAERGLPPPIINTVTFEPSRSCEGLSGRVIDDGTARNLYVCIYDSDVCTNAETCTSPAPSARITVLHELAHAWMLDHVDGGTVDDILALSNRTTWDDRGAQWSDRGVEYAADVMAWGLLDEALPMVRIGAPPCTELAAAFTLLSGAQPVSDRCP